MSAKKIVFGKSLLQHSKETGVHVHTLGRRLRQNPDITYEKFIKPADTAGGYAASHPQLHNRWINMVRRCTNPKMKDYIKYGGKGRKVCEEWLICKNFCLWALANGWYEGCKLTIDRIDNNGDYHPNNCRLVPNEVNQRNRGNNVNIEVDGQKHCIAEWERILGAKTGSLHAWAKRHSTDEIVKRIRESLIHGWVADFRKYLTVNGVTKSYSDWSFFIEHTRHTVSGWVNKYGKQDAIKRIQSRLSKLGK